MLTKHHVGLNSPLWYPLQTSLNMLLGIIGCYILFMGMYADTIKQT